MRKFITIAIALSLLMFLTVWSFSTSAAEQANNATNSGTEISYDVAKSDAAVQSSRQVRESSFEKLIESWNKLTGREREESEENDADLPAKARGKISKAEYMQLRSEYIARLRGIEPGMPFDVTARGKAVDELQQQEERINDAAQKGIHTNSFPPGNPPWGELGPRSLPNGQTQTGVTAPVDGRITAIAVDPTNSNNVYLGTAQGGVWRSSNGGTTWVSIFDNAQSLAIGALAIAPSSPNTLYIGTGEPNLCGDCFFGIGLYRIDNATTTTGAVADLIGPINPAFSFVSSAAGNPTINTTAFTGRSISQIVVDPTNAATIWVGTSTGTSGSGSNSLSGFIPPLALVGVYRSTNATSAAAAITFQKLAVDVNGGSLDLPGTGNRRISDLALEPGNPDNLLVSSFGGGVAGDGGIFRSTNARAATPTFSQNLTVGAQRIRFAINKVGATVTVLAATSESAIPLSCAATTQAGVLRRSVDGGVTWPAGAAAAGTGGILGSAGGYCGGQCFYNVTVAMNPTNANDMYLGGNARGTCSDAMKHSTDGLIFTRDDTTIHADSHALTYSADGNFIFTGNDGGVWKRTAQTAGVPTAAGTAWTNQNTSPLNMFQFVSLASHPTDRNFSIGGTQDNGTESQTATVGNWTSAEGGDGGYALIDQSSTDTVNVTMYHTFFNSQNALIGFDRANLGSCLAIKDGWEFRGFGGGVDPTPSCDGTPFAAANGIVGSDSVLFYAPMALGPGTPNTIYFGTSRLYRSTDKGDTMTTVSQVPINSASGTPTNANGSPISTIAISPQDDNYRLVGLQNGKVFGTSTGSSTLVDITSASFPASPTGSTTNKFVGRARVDPTNKDVAYVAFSFYAPAGQGVWKITNLGAATNAAPVAPVWTAAGTGIPSIPINAFVIDPTNGNTLFAGTDIGVYISRNGGTSWTPYGTGLPRVAVFDLSIQPTFRALRAATHGRGAWEIPLAGPTAAPANISGRITTPDGTPLAGVTMNLSGARTARAITDSNGNYTFTNNNTDSFYTVTPSLTNYHFGPENRSFSLVANKSDAVFTATRDAVGGGNAIDSAGFFVRQHYLDFLGREPDESGFNFWSNQILSCGGDAECIEQRTINVSAAYFLSIEFQETGGMVDGLYRASYGRRPLFAEFMPDTGTVARNVVVGRADWAQTLEANKQAFVDAWVERPAFHAAYDGLSNGAFVDTLIARAGAGFNGDRTALVSGLNGGTLTRAAVLRQVVENEGFVTAKRNETFVMMQYFGYLRRDPDAAGYQFWLNKLNQFNGNFEQAEMVKAFIISGEYRARFSGT